MAELQEIAIKIWTWLQETVLIPEVLGQFALLAVFAFGAHFIGKFTDKKLSDLVGSKTTLKRLEEFFEPLYFPVALLILIFVARTAGALFDLPVNVLEGAGVLTVAWIGVRIITRFIKSQRIARLLSILVVSIAGLEIAGLLDPLVEILKGFSITFGETTVSAFDIIWGLITLVIFVWVAFAISKIIDTQLKSMRNVNPSLKVLMTKITKIFLISIAFLISLNTMGIDLTALAVFGGALGVGLGFGLQKVVSNFISGVILLMDRSIKPGDVIQIEDTYGAINKLAARYTSVITRDGTEFLIPNEDMITQPVINWSHSNRIVRRRIPVQVEYSSDLNQAMDIMNASASDCPRVLEEPKPKTLLTGFGDNGVNLELRMWISDPEEGVSNIASEVMLEIWDRFHEAGIGFPFPQRVIHYSEDAKSRKPKSKAKRK